jgi:hypothetical protein
VLPISFARKTVGEAMQRKLVFSGVVLAAVTLASVPSATCQAYLLGELNTRQIDTLDKQKTVVLIPRSCHPFSPQP